MFKKWPPKFLGIFIQTLIEAIFFDLRSNKLGFKELLAKKGGL